MHMSSFWNFPFPSKIDTILKTNNFSLQDLLDEDDIVVDTKNHKIDLINFLSKEENVSKLLSYVVDEPPAEGSQKEKFRYPSISSEILVSSSPEMQVHLLTQESLDRLFNFFIPDVIPHQRAALVIQIINQLLLSHLKEILAYMHSFPFSLLHLIKHVEICSLTIFIFRLVHSEREEGGLGTHQWLVDIGALEVLQKQFYENNFRCHSDASNIMLELLNSVFIGSPIMEFMMEKERMTNFLEEIMNSQSSFRYGMNVFLIIMKKIIDSTLDTLDINHLKITSTSKISELPGLIQVLVNALPKFFGILNSENPSLLCSSDNFGYTRLRILQVVAALLSLHINEVTDLIIESGFINTTFDLLLKFPCNNFAHQAIEVVFSKLWEALDSERKYRLLISTNLPQKCVESDPENPINENKYKIRPPFLPYLHLIGLGILKAADSEQIQNHLNSIPGWPAFINKAEEKIESNIENQRRKFHPQGSLFRVL